MSELQIIDSHCHLTLLDSMDKSPGIEQALVNAKERGVSHMLTVAVDLDTLAPVIKLAEDHEHIYATVGVHPNNEVDIEPDVETLLRLADHPEVVAIGETGLDYFRSEGDLDWQRDRFRTHIQAAKQCQKPLVIHTREAKQDVIPILREEGAEAAGAVMHCFVEDWDTAKAALDMGFYISFSGIVTFNSAKDLQDVARKVPLDRLLVETDAPYLAPVPYRGKVNQPAYVREIAEFIAQLRGISVNTLAKTTNDNFFDLFKLSKSS